MREYLKKMITTDLIARLKFGTDMYISDIEIPGLHLRYSFKTGRKVYYLKYTLRLDNHRIDRNLKIGNFPEMNGTDARISAIKFRGLILAKIDPFVERLNSLRKKRLPKKISEFCLKM